MIVQKDLRKSLKKINPIRTYRLESISHKAGGKHALVAELDDLLKKNRCDFRKEYRRAIGNATKHGRFPIHCILYIGKKHFLIRIKDSGSGFDYQKTLRQYRRGEKYWRNRGEGFRQYMRQGFTLTFRKRGSEVFLIYPKKIV